MCHILDGETSAVFMVYFDETEQSRILKCT